MGDSSHTPVLIERVCGGWLAVAPQNAALKIGETGSTKEEAAQRFADAVRQCEMAAQASIY